ncbi:MAG: 30S ribosome-binding factor RbfA [Pseudomonadaceae bacterium]|nr:30S ribosome-binding factor RbfA [Pseudomonadaceae bacterium]
MKDYGRELKVADFIREELADIVTRKMRDPRVSLLAINEVKVSRDLSWADVYVTAVDCEGDARDELIAVLRGAAGFLRTEIAQRHTMRTTPRLRFHYDLIAETGPALEQLIERAVAQDDERRGDDESDPDAGVDTDTEKDR